MNLFVARHADALPVSGVVTRDADRPLSPRGERDSVAMGRAIVLIEDQIDKILTSPLARAQQTGELLGEELSERPVVRVTNNLAPGFSHGTLFKELMEFSGGADLVVVGHQPDMSMFIAYLIGEPNDAAIELTPCAVAKLKIPGTLSRPGARLSWVLTPEVIRSLHPQIAGE